MTEPSSRAELVAELRADAIRIGKAQGVDKERLSLWRAADAISALTAPLSADREAVARIIDQEAWDWLAKEPGWTWDVEDWNAWQAKMAHRRAISLAKADAILALTAPRGAGEDHVGDADDMVSGTSYAARPQPSSKSELQEPCDLEGWRAIESAPKDRFVLLYTPPEDEMEGFVAMAKWQMGSWYGVDDMGLTFNPLQAWDHTTHWRPLPPPPSDDPKPVLPANAKGMKP